MNTTPLHASRQRVLIAAAAALLSIGAAQATDLYDSLKIWKNQEEEANKIKNEARTSAVPQQPEPSPSDRGPQGPIRLETGDEAPAAQQEPAWQRQSPHADEAVREPTTNDPRLPSP